MATTKNRLSTFVSDEIKAAVEQYMIDNKIWSHSAAIAAILEEYFEGKNGRAKV